MRDSEAEAEAGRGPKDTARGSRKMLRSRWQYRRGRERELSTRALRYQDQEVCIYLIPDVYKVGRDR
jgi:hypothetical protein